VNDAECFAVRELCGDYRPQCRAVPLPHAEVQATPRRSGNSDRMIETGGPLALLGPNQCTQPGNIVRSVKTNQRYLKFPSQPIWASWSVG
jgi:hypothetical protein